MDGQTSFRTPLGKVRGLGAAKGGTGAHMVSRVTGLALLLLVGWFVVSAALSLRGGYETAFTWVRQPWNGAPLALLVALGAYHSAIGLQVVIEDYIHKHGAKIALLLFSLFAHVAVAAAGVYAILRISFGS